jgi:4-diphosphocytidyl-2-C-methyl-D-erythritol kinase
METNLKFLPVNDDNLCIKAAKLLIEEFNIKEGVHISLEKHIPVAAGMAGGSTDAASVLFGVNKLFDLKLSKQDLMDRGVKIGADVPYCIMRGTALAEGIGEVLSPLPPMVKCPVLIAKPGISVSTKQVYQSLDACFDKVEHPDIDGLITDITNKDLKGICSKMGNVLEDVTIPLHPVIADIKANMMENGAVGAMMSGSGPTVFGFFEDNKTARAAKDALTKTGMVKQLYLTTLFNN